MLVGAKRSLTTLTLIYNVKALLLFKGGSRKPLFQFKMLFFLLRVLFSLILLTYTREELPCCKSEPPSYKTSPLHRNTGREVPETADRRLQTRRMPLWNAWDCFITENLVLPVMYNSVHSVLVKQHGYIQWTNCTKNTLLGN